jgi:hypothetical protein
MDAEELKKQAERIKSSAINNPLTALTEAKEFLKMYAGENSTFYEELDKVKNNFRPSDKIDYIVANLNAFISYIGNGLMEDISFERKAQIDVVSDLLDQANTLLNTKEFHPAAPTVIIGASLEEFLRNWVEDENLNLEGQKPSLDTYANVLRKEKLITKQDIKDVTSWGGLRNHAAHGEWDEVSDKNRISLMLEGVNLFMRKYG